MPEPVLAELVAVGLAEPAGGPASAGVALPAGVAGPASAGVGPPMGLDPAIPQSRAQDEQECMNRYSGGKEVWDEYTGEVLPAAMVRKAREEELSMMEDWCVGGHHHGRGDEAGRGAFEGPVGGLQ